ncbi:MAG TPA: hypothetical protein PKA44_00125, partial [Saprospiraceae bacterium]|nr:hypothetical protein [Saprospiraceae bacterium]
IQLQKSYFLGFTHFFKQYQSFIDSAFPKFEFGIKTKKGVQDSFYFQKMKRNPFARIPLPHI